MMDALEILFTASFWVAVVRIASPLIFATMGELICERAGVLNLGIEGIMTVGAFAGWFTVYSGGDLWAGVLVAALAGALFGLLHATLTVPLGLSQHVVACLFQHGRIRRQGIAIERRLIGGGPIEPRRPKNGKNRQTASR